VEAKTGTPVGNPKKLLEDGFKAVFAAPGAWSARDWASKARTPREFGRAWISAPGE